MRIINMLFSVHVLSGKCVTFKDGKETCLKSMKEEKPTFGPRAVSRCTLNSPFFNIILLFLVLRMTQARILLPEQQGRIRPSSSLTAAFDQIFSVTEQTMLLQILGECIHYLVKLRKAKAHCWCGIYPFTSFISEITGRIHLNLVELSY
jgi:hypothetical protein